MGLVKITCPSKTTVEPKVCVALNSALEIHSLCYTCSVEWWVAVSAKSPGSRVHCWSHAMYKGAI